MFYRPEPTCPDIPLLLMVPDGVLKGFELAELSLSYFLGSPNLSDVMLPSFSFLAFVVWNP